MHSLCSSSKDGYSDSSLYSAPPAPPPTQGQPCLGLVVMLVAVFLPLFRVIPLWLPPAFRAGDSRMNHTN